MQYVFTWFNQNCKFNNRQVKLKDNDKDKYYISIITAPTVARTVCALSQAPLGSSLFVSSHTAFEQQFHHQSLRFILSQLKTTQSYLHQ